ncbi:MAG: PrsW family intramembrane metalloprotease [Clostridia bacterium]|nr:PrsW family intramembrane metalloprotease [Clostridia bacterium]
MLLFLLSPQFRLIVMALVPALILLVRVYRADRIEKEPASLLISLVLYGFISAGIAIVLETIGMSVIDNFYEKDTREYNLVLYFAVVGGSEELSKYLMLHRRTWRSRDFNCQFDGVVYSTFVSLGFAAIENVKYVLNFGFATALVRAVTAVPGHACFGVFMGVWYGVAKRYYSSGKRGCSLFFRLLSLAVPVFAHGLYDYSVSYENSGIPFFAVVAVIFILAFLSVRKASKNDTYIDGQY